MGGALPEAELKGLLTRIGFVEAEVLQRYDCARGTSREEIARLFGVTGINLRAVKPVGS